MAEAEKELGRFTLFGSTAKKERAVELYMKAANTFKAAKRWDEAGEAFMKSAGLYAQLGEDNEVLTCFTEAARSYRRSTHHDRAVDIFENNVIPRLLENGRHGQAAKLQQEIAEMYEEDGEVGGSMAAYSKSADLHLADNSKSAASKCQHKVALLSAQEGNYDLAIDTFEAIADTCLESNLLKFNAKGHLLCAALCVLAKGDLVLTERKIAEYKERDYTFGDSRECRLVEDVARAFADFSVDQFTDVVFEYDRGSKLDPWKTSILLKIKTKLSSAASAAVDVT